MKMHHTVALALLTGVLYLALFLHGKLSLNLENRFLTVTISGRGLYWFVVCWNFVAMAALLVWVTRKIVEPMETRLKVRIIIMVSVWFTAFLILYLLERGHLIMK